MDTKEAIEEVKQVFWVKYGKFGNEKADQIIELLQRGEKNKKYKEIVKEIKSKHGVYEIDHPFMINCQWTIKEMIGFCEQRHSPKPSKDFTKKVMAKIKEK